MIGYVIVIAMTQLSSFESWWYGSWPHRLYLSRFVPRFLHACPEPFRGEVLEVGSGGGWSSRQILNTFPQVELTASDVNPPDETSNPVSSWRRRLDNSLTSLGVTFSVRDQKIKTSLIGRFNVYNVLAALVAVVELGFDLKILLLEMIARVFF